MTTASNQSSTLLMLTSMKLETFDRQIYLLASVWQLVRNERQFFGTFVQYMWVVWENLFTPLPMYVRLIVSGVMA